MTSTAGHGVSLKAAHYADLLERGLPTEWAEALTENFLDRGGRPPAVLERVRRDARLILHGVSMSVGGLDPFDPSYFSSLRRLRDRIEAAFVSDHLCFGTVGGHHGHDLWPLPMNEESLHHVVSRVRQAQDMLEGELVLENVSTYVTYTDSDIAEPDFIAAILEEANAGMLLDVNNVHVSAQNLGLDPIAYVNALPAHRIRYIHLAGHADMGTHLVDNHGAPVCDAVWSLYEHTIARLGPTPTIVEWDSHLPSLDGLLAESQLAREHERRALEARAA
mgnify:CR=1 FL=1